MAPLAIFLERFKIKTPEVIFHICLGAQEVIRLAFAMALSVALTKESTVWLFFFQLLKI